VSGHGHDVPLRRCVVCRAPSAALLCTAETIGRDLARARRGLDGFVHDHARAVYRCASCGSAFRDPLARRGDDVARYARCRYRRDTLDELCRRARAELDRRAPRLRARGVVAGARLLEIGSYSGAFLEFAHDAGCRVTGIDINADIVAHCEARGLEIHCEAFDPDHFEVGEFDGVWILNCFEQLSDHTRVLAGAARVLRPNGTLVIRTPNADFVRLLYAPRGGAILGSIGKANALLGVPFAKCFSAGALTRAIEEHGMAVEQVEGQEFSSIAPVRRALWWTVARALRVAAYRVGSLAARRPLYPWLEVTARRTARSPTSLVGSRSKSRVRRSG
jgi:SAM-dependent methyltransferase